MSQLLWLAPHAHAVAVDGDLVFLDLRTDAYACLPGEGAILCRDGRSLAPTARELADDLRAAGLVADAAGPVSTPYRSLPPATRSLVRRDHGRMKPGDIFEIGRGLADVLLHYRGRPLQAIVAQAQRERLCAAPRLTSEVGEAAEALQRWAPYAPLSGKCLLRSFLLLRRLRSRGLDAHWVFGVRTWPFSAHCWLQCEDAVLDDHLDRTRGYAPILVV